MADKQMKKELPRSFCVPQVDKLLRHPEMQARLNDFRRDVLANLTRQVLDECRQESLPGGISLESKPEGAGAKIDESYLVRRILSLADELATGGLQRVINGTGVILNTNLGRAPLPPAVLERLNKLLPGYSSLEFDLNDGGRGERAATIERQLVVLTGCEAAIVVNNCAAAVLLLVNALACGREVIVSRGELIEIGGSFRLPDVIVAGGAILKEIGTTNRTRVADYENAINENTALMLKCHRSNFEITGFTEEAGLDALQDLSRKKKIPLVEDLGSGALLDLSQLKLAHEPTVSQVVKLADVVMFSGDKLLGGSQAGLIVGKRGLIEKLRRHPTYRALRLDKLNIALLESTLAEYLRPDAINRLPVYQMALLSQESLRERAALCVARLSPKLTSLQCSVVETNSTFGGGTLPNVILPGCGIRVGIAPGAAFRFSPGKMAARLRKNRPALLTLTSEQSLVIDLRTVHKSEEADVESALAALDQFVACNV